MPKPPILVLRCVQRLLRKPISTAKLHKHFLRLRSNTLHLLACTQTTSLRTSWNACDVWKQNTPPHHNLLRIVLSAALIAHSLANTHLTVPGSIHTSNANVLHLHNTYTCPFTAPIAPAPATLTAAAGANLRSHIPMTGTNAAFLVHATAHIDRQVNGTILATTTYPAHHAL